VSVPQKPLGAGALVMAQWCALMPPSAPRSAAA